MSDKIISKSSIRGITNDIKINKISEKLNEMMGLVKISVNNVIERSNLYGIDEYLPEELCDIIKEYLEDETDKFNLYSLMTITLGSIASLCVFQVLSQIKQLKKSK
ncbi:MAG: hypothetical protein Solumvirus7_6 [Solumvirus sp.]|uniref:Uncharacterized protein n=1 Tax=Solumvirus sp. TaxID=2487773 RepID=A0A3G5AJ96_9VIRU|nr:MAG: hypothetical protein Solumvirus7_6 [Solumvirus sp.]